MASLQKYPGRGKDAGKTFYRIQPYLPCGKRITIRLGTGSKNAEASSKAIHDLIDSLKAGSDAGLNAKTRSWLADTADRSICQTLLDCGLLESLPDRHCESTAKAYKISNLAAEYIRTRGTGHEASTITIYEKAKNNLIECFGDVDISVLVASDGREFWRWLQEDKELALNTAKQRLRYARAFFELAIEDNRVDKNPFKAQGLSVTQSAAAKEYISRDVVDRIIDHCPNDEWKRWFVRFRHGYHGRFRN